MFATKRTLVYALLVTGLTVPAENAGIESVRKATPVLWRNPVDIASRNLYYGPGGPQHQPHGPYIFVKEDLDGSNPKFVVKDRDGIKWKVKLGMEARPETAATRLIWAVGYFANEDYFLSDVRVENMPAHLHRGQSLVAPDGSVRNVRMKREDEKKIGDWKWRHNPFTGTREWNGLRVMMALINNWDLKDQNNSVYRNATLGNVYMVSDLGASFGSGSPHVPIAHAKGDLRFYRHSRFIRDEDVTTVSFGDPGRPEWLWFVHPIEYFKRIRLCWIGRDIPRADARWAGDLLSRLSDRQIEDAFRAAGYPDREARGFASTVQRRIAELSEL